MDEKFIVIPRMLLARARRRATERGFSGLAEYVAELIRKDTIRKPAIVAPLLPVKRASGNRRRREAVSTIRKRVLDGMFSYMKASKSPGHGYACGYTLKDIDRCAVITRDFLAKLRTVPKGEATKVQAAVKRVVLKLNKLNASCGGALIETDQREDLYLLIDTAAKNAGLKSDEDITAPWREW